MTRGAAGFFLSENHIMAQGVLVGTSGGVKVGGGVQATNSAGKCPVCGCGGETAPACCTSNPLRFSYLPGGQPATIALSFSGSYSAAQWTYNTGLPPFPTYAVAPTVTATMTFGSLRTVAAPPAAGCVDDGHQLSFDRDETHWYTNPGNNAATTAESVSFAGATDIGSDSSARPGVLTKSPSIGVAQGANIAVEFYSLRRTMTPIPGAIVAPGFLWAEVVASLSMVASMMQQWIAAPPGGVTLGTDGIVFTVYFDSAGRTAVDLLTSFGATGTASGSMPSVGTLSVSFSFATPSVPGALGLQTPACTLAGTLTATSNRLPCVPYANTATSALACARIQIDGYGAVYPPPDTPPPPSTLPLVEPTDDPILSGGYLLP
jgi:hypothetical protein